MPQISCTIDTQPKSIGVMKTYRDAGLELGLENGAIVFDGANSDGQIAIPIGSAWFISKIQMA
jgi:hypothetical protein